MGSLSSHVDAASAMVLNADNKSSLSTVLSGGGGGVLRSDESCDHQLLIMVPFKEKVKVRGVRIVSNPTNENESAPKSVKIWIDQPHFSFSDVEDATPVQSFELDEKDVDGKEIKLAFVKYQSVSSLTIFIGTNQKDTDVTILNKLEFIGCPKEGTNMANLKKVDDHE